MVVKGRVQGVFFRQSCRELAVASGVRGWVRNRVDGAVEVRMEGSPGAVDRLVEWCRQGPPHAVVTAVEEQDRPMEHLRGFAIR